MTLTRRTLLKGALLSGVTATAALQAATDVLAQGPLLGGSGPLLPESGPLLPSAAPLNITGTISGTEANGIFVKDVLNDRDTSLDYINAMLGAGNNNKLGLTSLGETWNRVLAQNARSFPLLAGAPTIPTTTPRSYLAVRRGISGNVSEGYRSVSGEEESGTLELLDKFERTAFWGMALGPGNLFASAAKEDAARYRGILEQLPPEHIIDARSFGSVQEALSHVATLLRSDGKIKDVGYSHAVISSAKELVPGNAFATRFGTFAIQHSHYLERVEAGRPVRPDEVLAYAPKPPVKLATLGGAHYEYPKPGMATLSKGHSWYWVSAVDVYGESLPTFIGSRRSPVNNRMATHLPARPESRLTFSRTFGIELGPSGVTAYRVYRNDRNNSVAEAGIVAELAPTENYFDGGMSWTDPGDVVPNTDLALVYPKNMPDDLRFEAWTAAVKWPLAVVSTKIEFLVLRYMTPVVGDPSRTFVITNLPRKEQ